MTTSGELYFDIDARHVRQLGRELVADRVTAVSELIKNSYDADATHVEVAFTGASRAPGGTLTISDDGEGMTFEDLRDGWMRISTDYKERSSASSRYGRPRAGRKGIGRFAAESLGARLLLKSTVRGTTERIAVRFNWESAYIAGANLGEIPNPYTIESAPPEEHGTVLVIEDLHDTWSAASLQRVRKSILLLQPPFPVTPVAPSPDTDRDHEPDPGFVVEVRDESSSEQPSRSGIDDFLSAATATIEGRVDPAGVGSWRAHSSRLRLDETSAMDKRVLIAGPFWFRAAYFVYASGASGNASITVSMARKFGNDYGGIRLYRDELRILPYGDQNNDWLGLDEIYRRRGSVLAPIGNINFFGQVSITRSENILLVDTASREGVVENEAFVELQAFVQRGIVWGVEQVAAARQRKTAATRPRPQVQTRRQLVDRIAERAESVAHASEGAVDAEVIDGLRRVLSESRREAAESDRAEQEAAEELINDVELLRVLASLGSAIAVFSHEVRGVLNSAAGVLGDIEDELQEADGSSVRALDLLKRAQSALEQLQDLASYIEVYISHSRRRRREPQALHETLHTFIDAFDTTLNRSGVDISVQVEPPYLRTMPISRSELEAVLFNLLTNSIKALDREGHIDRRIRVTAIEDSGDVLIRFQDTGVGIKPSIRDRIFDAFVTEGAPADTELGVGTGIGLKIVRDIAEANEGSVGIGDPDAGYVTCFDFRLPMWSPGEEDGA